MLDYQDWGNGIELKGYTVYLHVNKTNGKKYVGITKQRLYKRWQNGNGYKNNQYFYQAITKYGWDGFYHYIIKTGLSCKEAEEIEIYLISKFNSNNYRYGYNITSGGEVGKTFSEETKRKISESRKGKYKGPDNPNYGKHYSDEVRKKLSLINTGKNNPFYGKNQSEKHRQKMMKMIGENHPNFGKHPSEETRKKLSLSRTGVKSPVARKIFCITTNETFNTVTEAVSKYNISGTSNISRCCLHKRKTAGKHPITGEPLRWIYADEGRLTFNGQTGNY
jgi:group I intron endonuclease